MKLPMWLSAFVDWLTVGAKHLPVERSKQPINSGIVHHLHISSMQNIILAFTFLETKESLKRLNFINDEPIYDNTMSNINEESSARILSTHNTRVSRIPRLKILYITSLVFK